MPRTIEILFTDKGTVTIEAIGFQGKSCEEATAAYEKELGTVTKRRKKPEYYATVKKSQQQRT